jgi:hypothetical protein
MADENLSWNSECSQESEYNLMPENTEVSFDVVGFERATTRKGAPMAKLTLKCKNTETDSVTTVKDKLVLMRSCEWKICQFFTCLGLRKHGEKSVPKWDAVLGSKGLARLGIEEWQTDSGDARERNIVKSYLDPVPAEDGNNPF